MPLSLVFLYIRGSITVVHLTHGTLIRGWGRGRGRGRVGSDGDRKEGTKNETTRG